MIAFYAQRLAAVRGKSPEPMVLHWALLRCAGYGYEGGIGTTLRANRDSTRRRS
jgi:hypothetical protein